MYYVKDGLGDVVVKSLILVINSFSWYFEFFIVCVVFIFLCFN